MSSIAIDYRNESTGFVGRSVVMASYGANGATTGLAGGLLDPLHDHDHGDAPNGSVQATRSQTVTAPGAPPD